MSPKVFDVWGAPVPPNSFVFGGRQPLKLPRLLFFLTSNVTLPGNHHPFLFLLFFRFFLCLGDASPPNSFVFGGNQSPKLFYVWGAPAPPNSVVFGGRQSPKLFCAWGPQSPKLCCVWGTAVPQTLASRRRVGGDRGEGWPPKKKTKKNGHRVRACLFLCGRGGVSSGIATIGVIPAREARKRKRNPFPERLKALGGETQRKTDVFFFSGGPKEIQQADKLV